MPSFADSIRYSLLVVYAFVRVAMTGWILVTFAHLAAEHATARRNFAWSLTGASGVLSIVLWVVVVRRLWLHRGGASTWIVGLCVSDELYFIFATCAFGTSHTTATIAGTSAPPVLATLFVGLDLGLLLALGNAVALAVFATAVRHIGSEPLASIIPQWPLFAAYGFLYTIPAWMFGRLLVQIERLQRRVEVSALSHNRSMRDALRRETEANRVHNDLHSAENGLFALESILGGMPSAGVPTDVREQRVAVAFAARSLGDELRSNLSILGREDQVRRQP